MSTRCMIAILLSTAMAFAQAQPDEASIELLLAKEQYSKAIQVLQTLPDYAANPRWQEQQARALIGLQRYEHADTLLDEAIMRFAQAGDLYMVSALNKFAMAEQAGLLSAPGYVKAGLARLQQAARLSAGSADAQLKLLGFYLQAPGFMGGDEKAGKQIASDLQGADPIDAAIANSMVYSDDEQFTRAIAVLDDQLKKSPDNVRLLVQKAKLLRISEQDAAALPLYLQAAGLADDAGSRHQYLYQVGRIAAATAQSKKDVQQIDAGKDALQQAIAFYQQGEGPSVHWARLKLAQLYLIEQNFNAAGQQLAPLLALTEPAEPLEQEIKKLHKQMEKLKKKQQQAGG